MSTNLFSDTEILPLLDHIHTEGRSAMSRPLLTSNGEQLPRLCLMSFMQDTLQEHVETNGCQQISNYHSETKDFPIYLASRDNIEMCLVQAPVGAPAAAILADLLIASGVDTLISCGGCGVLTPITSGKIILPTSALRDEGTSYHYLPPSAWVTLSKQILDAATLVLKERNIPYQEARVWTSDGFFRETPLITELRREQGCTAVDMECAALAAVAQAYGVRYGSILYSGDTLESDTHDERDWITNVTARQAAFDIAFDTLLRL